MTTNNEHQIMFEQIGLASILKQNHLKVPPNQRNYTWDEKRVKQLFQDLARTIDEGDYFLGTIVTIPRENGILTHTPPHSPPHTTPHDTPHASHTAAYRRMIAVFPCVVAPRRKLCGVCAIKRLTHSLVSTSLRA